MKKEKKKVVFDEESKDDVDIRVFQDSRFSLKKKAEPTKHKPGGHIERIQKDF